MTAKGIFWTIFWSLLGAGLLTGCGFYFIPKYAQKKTTGFTNFIDSAVDWISKNWIATIVIVVAVALAIILAVCLCNTKKR